MSASTDTHHYEAQIKIGDKILSKSTGNSVSELQVFLSGRCELEQSGAEGQIIELSTGKVIYSCRKQTIIDQ